jgi:cytochrome b subunit of formate dehydrogenase/nitrate/TMAO reductase-like tetraheme cytochrome c subunit
MRIRLIAIQVPGLLVSLIAAAAPASGPSSRSAPTNAACLECHRDGVEGKHRVDPKGFDVAPHTEENGVSCASCHTKAAAVADITDHGRLGPASCDGCHESARDVAKGVHRQAGHGGRRPTCGTCHGTHAIRPVADPSSPVHATRQVATCGKCHERSAIEPYRRSVHGRRLEAGRADGPTCSTCHTGHAIPRADVVRNPKFKEDLTRRCGQCHTKEMKVYAGSTHGVALLQRDVAESASCVDCHRSHEILPPTDPRSAVFPTKVVRDCAGCHADTRLIRHRHLPSDVVSTYELSYHGRASERGEAQVANCSSCHEHHAIYPRSDRRSSIHPSNLRSACGKCHPGASENFIRGKIHVVAEGSQNRWAFLVRSLYIWLIALLIGGMVLHNLMDFVRKMILRARHQASVPHIVRMTRQERVAHVLMLASFILLAYTGFALRYPTAWWAAPLGWLASSEQLRKLLHRGAGLVLTAIMLQHLWFLFLNARGREQRRQFMPRLKDVRDLLHNILFYIGVRRERAVFGRFSYIEKAEYWALVWGTGVMVATGFILWFEQLSLAIMPRWLWEVFLVVHRFEAILAVLAVVVWHFYHVFISPDEAPMALTWITGKMTLEELAELHPAEFAELQARGVTEATGAGEVKGATVPAKGAGGEVSSGAGAVGMPSEASGESR